MTAFNCPMTWLVLLTTLSTMVVSIKFSLSLAGHGRICFEQYLIESTPYHIHTEADHPLFNLKLVFSQDDVLMEKTEDNVLKRIDSYAAVSGEYSFCLQSRNPEAMEVIVTFLEGLELLDVGSLPGVDQHRLIERLVEDVNRIFQVVKDQSVTIRVINEFNMELQKLVSFKSVGFAFLSITLIVIISFLHYLEIKRVLRTRKVI